MEKTKDRKFIEGVYLYHIDVTKEDDIITGINCFAKIQLTVEGAEVLNNRYSFHKFQLHSKLTDTTEYTLDAVKERLKDAVLDYFFDIYEQKKLEPELLDELYNDCRRVSSDSKIFSAYFQECC